MSSTKERAILLRKVREAVLSSGATHGSGMAVAVSAGADSTALLAALEGCDDLDLHLIAVHVDHGIRPRKEGDEDVRLLQGIARALGIELVVERIAEGRIAHEAKRQKRSIEELAREKRYERLHRVAEERDLPWIAVGHTRDDQMETVLMRLFQGGLLQGLAGIPAKRGKIIRPLLHCTRDEVVDYLAARGLPFRTDSTNADERYLRNRIRKRLTPEVRRVFPASYSAIENFVGQVGALNELLDGCTEAMLPWRKRGTAYEVSARRFFGAPGEIRVRSVLRLFDREGGRRRIPRRFLKPLESAVARRGRHRIATGFGAVIEQSGETVFWRPDVVLETKKSYLIGVFEPTMYHITPDFSFTVSRVPKGSTGDHGIGLPEALVRHPLVVRSRKPGDTIRMHDGDKSLKKLLNEWGVHETLRDQVPIIEDRDGIWAVAGSAFGYQDRLRNRSTGAKSAETAEGNIVFAFEYSGEKV